MKTFLRTKARLQSGFTLVELLIVMAILAILMTLTFGGVRYALKSGYEKKTVVQIEAIKAALEAFHADYGAYPSFSTGSDPSGSFSPDNLPIESSKWLYKALSGDTMPDGEGNYGQIDDDDVELDWFDNPSYDSETAPKAKSYLDELVNTGSQQGWVVLDNKEPYIVDGFSNPIQYYADPNVGNGQNAPDHYDLWSFGMSDTEDSDDFSLNGSNKAAKWIKNW